MEFTEVSAGHTQGPHRRQDEDAAGAKEDGSRDLDQGSIQDSERRLGVKRIVVPVNQK